MGLQWSVANGITVECSQWDIRCCSLYLTVVTCLCIFCTIVDFSTNVTPCLYHNVIHGGAY